MVILPFELATRIMLYMPRAPYLDELREFSYLYPNICKCSLKVALDIHFNSAFSKFSHRGFFYHAMNELAMKTTRNTIMIVNPRSLVSTIEFVPRKYVKAVVILATKKDKPIVKRKACYLEDDDKDSKDDFYLSAPNTSAITFDKTILDFLKWKARALYVDLLAHVEYDDSGRPRLIIIFDAYCNNVAHISYFY